MEIDDIFPARISGSESEQTDLPQSSERAIKSLPDEPDPDSIEVLEEKTSLPSNAENTND